MNPNRKETEILNSAIDEWLKEGKISDDQAKDLKQDIASKNAPSRQVAHYFFFIALSCILLAFAAIFIDDKLLEKVKIYFSLSDITIAVLFTILSAIALIFVRKRKDKYSPVLFEVYNVISSLLVLTATVYACKITGPGPKYSGFLLASTLLLFALSVWQHSRALWIMGILSAMGWYGALSSWMSHDDLFIGMNYPVRFTIFGVIIIAASYLQSTISKFTSTYRLTYMAGLIILLTGLWGVSVFGNYASLDDWSKVRQVQVIWYGLLFAIVAVALLFYAVKHNDDTTRDIALVAILVNLYSRYFEFFWNTTNKGIFFLVLGVSFWFVGRKIERSKRFKKLTDNV